MRALREAARHGMTADFAAQFLERYRGGDEAEPEG